MTYYFFLILNIEACNLKKKHKRTLEITAVGQVLKMDILIIAQSVTFEYRMA